MEAERQALIDSLATHCIRCQVPYGYGPCTHTPPTAERLLRTVIQIGWEEERRQRVRNAQHALRYRREARNGRVCPPPIRDYEVPTSELGWS